MILGYLLRSLVRLVLYKAEVRFLLDKKAGLTIHGLLEVTVVELVAESVLTSVGGLESC